MIVLSGDIGGTNSRVAVFETVGGALRLLADGRFPSKDASGLEEIVARFLNLIGKPLGVPVDVACFGVAGPVRDGRCVGTNLPWIVDAKSVAAATGIARTWILNDLEALAWGVATLGPEDYVTLREGAPDRTGNQAIIAAGTGLGEAALHWTGEQHEPLACEGGHSSFAPGGDLEIELLRHLSARFGGHVSWERLVSGQGLVNIYQFLRDTGRGVESEALRAEIAAGDDAAAISRAGLAGESELASAALDLFVSLYGAEAGNFALKTLATGGVWLGGGIAPKILARLREGAFLRSFDAKGRLRPLLEKVPVRVITNDNAALFGAARCGVVRTVIGRKRRATPEIGPTTLADARAVAKAAAIRVYHAAEEAVSRRGRFTVALSGGSTPKTLFQMLAAEPFRDAFPWKRTHFFWGDERHVPPDHADSNYRMAREAMLAKVDVPAENIHRIRGEEADAATAARLYAEEIAAHVPPGLSGMPRFDLVLLGMGADSHTASIFPGTDAVGEREKVVVAPWVEKLKANRITLSPAAINAAREVLFLVAGADKADAVHAVLKGERDIHKHPSQAIAPTEGELLWMLDKAAAAKIEAKE